MLSLVLLSLLGTSQRIVTDKRPLPASVPAKEKQAEKMTKAIDEYVLTFGRDSVADAAAPAFAGFDKGVTSAKESFFVTNRSDDTLEEFTVEILYTNMEGEMLHKRQWNHKVTIPPGETRRVDIPSWDIQHQFHYHLTRPLPKREHTLFRVRFRPLSGRYREK